MSRKDKIIMLFILSVGFLAHAPNFMDFMWPHCISFVVQTGTIVESKVKAVGNDGFGFLWRLICSLG